MRVAGESKPKVTGIIGLPRNGTSVARTRIFSISSQLSYGLPLLVVLSLVIVAGILVIISYQTQRQQVENLQRERSHAAATEINTFLDDLRRKLEYLSRVKGLTEFPQETQQNLLEGLARHNSAYEALSILDNTGQTVSSVVRNNRERPDNLANSPEFLRPFKRHEDYISAVVHDPAINLPVVNLSVPIRDESDEVDGVLYASVSLEFLRFFISQVDVGETGYAYVVDNRGFVIAEKDGEQENLSTDNVSDEPFTNSLFSQPASMSTISTYQGLRGVKVIGSNSPVRSMRWQVFVELPTDEAYAPIKNMLLAMGAAASGLAVIAIGSGILLSRRIVRPLRLLTQASSEIAAGNMDTQVNISNHDEMGILAQTFNVMVMELKQAEIENRQLATNLECRVQERTKELSVANDRLQREVLERTLAQREMREFAEKLEMSNRELQDFASVAAHDLQEPLRKIQAFGDRLKTSFADSLDDRGIDYLKRMQDASARMAILIHGLLEYSRVATMGQPFVQVDLNKIVREVVSDLEIRIEEMHGRVELEDLPTIDADPLQMRQLLQNLIGNGLKYCRPGEAPVVKIRGYLENCSKLPNSENPSDQVLGKIIVEDNGIGFEEKYADRIFGIFQRLHARNEYEGTGVGLAVCRKVVDRHGGSIIAKGVPDQGATFTVSLPAKQQRVVEREEVERV